MVDTWLGSTNPISAWDDTDRAYATARHIAERSVSITVQRTGSTLDAQTVRVEPLSNPAEQSTVAGGTAARAGVLVLGYKSHPSITDTDLQRGDQFAYDDMLYTVTQVLPNVPDRLLAIAEVRE